MNSEENTSPRASASQLLAPLAWLLIAVAAPAALVWFSSSEPSQVTAPVGNADRSPTGDGAVALRPAEALAEHRAEQRQWLESYGWVDREGGVARVPIEEGMRAVLRDGLPAREESEGQR